MPLLTQKDIDLFAQKILEDYDLKDPRKIFKNKIQINNILKKGDLILTGVYGFPIPINKKKVIEVTSSAFGDVKAIFN